MAHKLDDARRSLVRAKKAAQARLEQLGAERQEIKTSMKSLDAALRALGVSKTEEKLKRSVPSQASANQTES